MCDRRVGRPLGFLEADPGVAFEVSENEPPYAGIRGSAEATLRPDEDKRLLRDLLERYLGGTDSPLARRLLAEDREEVRIRLDPPAPTPGTERMRDAVGSREGREERL